MKKTLHLTAWVLMVVFVLSSCDLVKDLLDINFTTGYKDVPFTVDTEEAGEHKLVEKYIQSDLKKEIEDNGGDISNLQNVEVDKAQLEVQSPGRNLDPFSWVKVYLSTPNIPTKLVASVASIGVGETLINLDIEPISLNDILEEEEYIVTVVGELDQDLKDPIDLVVRLMYEVTVKP
jgi:hypothetical protein